MTDHELPANLTEEEVERARRWAEGIEANPKSWSLLTRTAARVVLHAVPAPPRPTLADMTDEQRDACTGMQADLAQGDRVVILDGTPDHDGLVQVLEKSLDVYRAYPKEVTPRPDLPRLTWPGTEKPAPAPALPEGWRLADHEEDGRVIVTNPTPSEDDRVYYVIPSADPLGFDWLFCDPAELTYIDQEADQ